MKGWLDYDGQIIFGDLTDIYLTGEEKPRKKKFAQETCPDRGSNQGPLRDRRARNRLLQAVDPKEDEKGWYESYPMMPCPC